MNAKRWMMILAVLAMCGTAHALTSEEIAEVLDVEGVSINCGDGITWIIDTNVWQSGSSSLRSASIGDSQSTSISIPIIVDKPKRFQFWYKTSTESGCDTLTATFNGATLASASGETDWKKATFVAVPGMSCVLKVTYKKDGSAVRGSDCVWIDGLSATNIMEEATKVIVRDIICTQRYPWNGMVDIDYTVESEDASAEVWVYPIGYDKDSNTSMAPRALTGDGVGTPVGVGTHRMTWTVTDDYPEFHSTAFTVKMIALTGAAPYMVVDLSGGVDALSYPVSYLSSVPEGGWSDEYKTTKLVLRLIPPGSFVMGSPSDESGRWDYEDLHGVVLTKPFYIGVFEVTQKQYELIMGANPSNYKGEMRPVENIAYNKIRGSVNGIGWPTHNQVDADSFMGRLRSKVNMLFDLPTEAQWEYACRAGTSTALNSGKNYDRGANCNEVARWTRNAKNSGSDYQYDGKGGYTYTTVVGCYLENAWGLYDMHGNVWEWCRDFWNYGLGTAGVVNPVGASKGYSSGDERVYRGGGCNDDSGIRSACRNAKARSSYTSADRGFRVMCSPVAE